MSVPPAISDATRAARRSRRRGARGELEVTEILKDFGWIKARRNLLRDIVGRQERGDIAGGPQGCSIEVKLVEKLNLRKAYAQCERDAGPEIPIVVHRCNSQPWLATLPADELFALLRLREVG